MILLVSADSFLRLRWRQALERGIETAALADLDALDRNLAQHPDALALVDLRLLGVQPQTALPRLLDGRPNVRLVLMGNVANERLELSFFQTGVRAVCPASVDDASLQRLVGAVQRGELWLRRSMVGPLLDALRQQRVQPDLRMAAVPGSMRFPGMPTVTRTPASLAPSPSVAALRLTQRERQIADLVGAGRSNKLIARELGITERTVKAHLTEIFRKAGVNDRVNLVLRMRLNELPAPPLA